MTDQLEGQMSIFDLDLGFGRMCREHYQAELRKERTSESCWKSLQGFQTRQFQYLCLNDGQPPVPSLETAGASLGGSSTFSFGDAHNEEEEFIYWLISLAKPLLTSYCAIAFNPTEHPVKDVPSKLSWILQSDADQKYYLSVKACQGILNRASKRGKELPEILKNALESVVRDQQGSAMKWEKKQEE